MEPQQPILTQKEKGTLVKAGLGVLAFSWLSGEILFIVCIGILLAIGAIGIVIGLAGWFLKYGLLALGIYVIFVLTLRWLHGGKKARDPSAVEQFVASQDARTERLQDIDPKEALARFKAEHMAEAPPPTPPRHKP